MDTSDFVLISHWRIDAPRRRVWDALHEPTGWPDWWPYVAAVEKLDTGDPDGVGARYRFHWTSRLPYSIRIATHVVDVVPQQTIRAEASGDLDGEGTWRLGENGSATDVEYTWRVRLTSRWMRLFAPLLRPVFTWNHNAVMAAGEEGLRKYLAAHSV
ncbi:MAG TPA: SRPBCC family protein [Rudaea sp.]|nr:SRPBCC family protein [Rudaea sp.]